MILEGFGHVLNDFERFRSCFGMILEGFGHVLDDLFGYVLDDLGIFW